MAIMFVGLASRQRLSSGRAIGSFFGQYLLVILGYKIHVGQDAPDFVVGFAQDAWLRGRLQAAAARATLSLRGRSRSFLAGACMRTGRLR